MVALVKKLFFSMIVKETGLKQVTQRMAERSGKFIKTIAGEIRLNSILMAMMVNWRTTKPLNMNMTPMATGPKKFHFKIINPGK